jgi:hypothetical protein
MQSTALAESRDTSDALADFTLPFGITTKWSKRADAAAGSSSSAR